MNWGVKFTPMSNERRERFLFDYSVNNEEDRMDECKFIKQRLRETMRKSSK